MNLRIQVQHSPFWTYLAFACKTETLGSLYDHALLILTKSSKSKNQVVHEQKFKCLPSSTCQISSKRKVLDLSSILTGGNYCQFRLVCENSKAEQISLYTHY